MNKEQWGFHGDVNVVLNVKIPENAKPVEKMPDVIQWGEVSNHAHRLYGDGFTIFETPEKKRFLRIVKPTALKHEEHREVTLPPGDHEIRITRELGWFDDMVNPVVD